jgi:hypothetical protein
MPQEIRAESLAEEELRWCEDMRRMSLDLCEVYAGSRPKTNPTIREIHDAYEGWLAATQPRGLFRKFPKGHPDANAVAMALGVALGDQIAGATGMKWKIITDAYGTDLGLFFAGMEGTYSDIVTHPMNFIAKRIVERQSGWLVPAATQLIDGIHEMTGGQRQ